METQNLSHNKENKAQKSVCEALFPVNHVTQEKGNFFLTLFPSITFYAKTLAIVCSAEYRAKKGTYDAKQWLESSYDIAKAVEAAGGKIVVEGVENFMNIEGPCVFVANHMSTLETFALPVFIQPYKDVSYIVKSSLTHYPLFGNTMRSRQPILLERVNPREDFAKAMKEGVEVLNGGRSLIIFPQGTRKQVFNEADFNSLGAKLAKKANVPLVPIALKTDFWGVGKFIKEIGKISVDKIVHFSFGKAMKIEGSGKEEHQACIEFIKNNLTKWEKEEN